MQQRLKQTLLSLFVLTIWTNLSANTPAAQPQENPPCDFPAVNNFAITGTYADGFIVAWDPQSPLPANYNIKVYKTNTWQLVYEQTFSSIFNMWRIVGLDPGTNYTIQHRAVCPDGTISHYFAQGIGNTLIVDLVTSALTPPTNQGFGCGMNLRNQYCDAYPDNGNIVYFRVQPTGNTDPSVGRYFGVYNLTGSCDHDIIKVLPATGGGAPYGFFCNTATSMNCTGSKTTITFNGTPVAAFSIDNIQGAQHLYITETINTNYQIVRVSSPTGVYCPEDGNCGGAPTGMKAGKVEYHSDTNQWGNRLDVSPNPFRNQLDVWLPESIKDKAVVFGIYDMQGRMLKNVQTIAEQESYHFDTSDMMPGMYFLRAESEGEVYIAKVVKVY